ncbi:hypothetical protein H310_11751 [Aphanomyces invadans]|uniref:Uncharacterized protein n=1 Tax=Aphanomyces invadans TaxID=157072 RepID=A0A024TLF0_9STRA|nr:hypothetical protein H310_11751 [Aphanomyces invadans]ETV94426.1 hypothetical protein H310_11751 [Aphanomyces invadans]|eukprot:XP_008876741.1 hypothetical protein H310_11751 [Aphanomyces invadans]
MDIATSNDYLNVLTSVLQRQTIKDMLYEGIMSTMLYWTIFGYILSSAPLAVWNLHKYNLLRRVSWKAILGGSVGIFTLAWLIADSTPADKIFFIVGAGAGVFCTHLHFEIAELISGHIEAAQLKKQE